MTGRRGPLSKPQSRSGHRVKSPAVSIVPAAVVQLPVKVKIPTPPKGLLPATRRGWRIFWESPDYRAILSEPQHRAVRRLFELYDQRDRAYTALAAAMFVKGSAGQIRLNPAGDFILRLEEKILRLEDQLGLTPMSAARLGIAIGDAHRSLADLKNAAAKPPQEVDVRDHAVSPDDPRLAPVEFTPRDS